MPPTPTRSLSWTRGPFRRAALRSAARSRRIHGPPAPAHVTREALDDAGWGRGGFDRDVELWSGTLSKALASCGGYVAAGRTVVDYLRYTVPAFVYSAGMTPANTAASLAALRVLQAEPDRVRRLRENSALFVQLARRAGINTGHSHDTPVIPCIIGESHKTLQVAEALFRQGVSVNPILYPAVPEEQARLRFFLTRDHTPDQIHYTVRALTHALRRTGTAAA
jgi:7-keto-8-aminopelargonate synthetase-like enzyme